MATDDFNRANESPLASPWGAWGSYTTCRLVSNALQNSSGDGESGCLRTDSAEGDSDFIYVSGTTDGGPAIHCGNGPDGYFMTSYDGLNTFMFRLDDGSFNQVGSDMLGTYVTGQRIRLRRSGGNLIYSLNGVDLMTRAESTYTGGNDGAFVYAGNLILDGWTNNASAAAFSLAIDSISYALSLQAVTLRAARRVPVDNIGYALTLQSVGLRHGPFIVAENITYSLTLQAVTLTGPSADYSLAIDSISYALTLADAMADYEMDVGSISYALTLQDVSLEAGRKTVAESIGYSLSLQDVAMSRTRVLRTDNIAYTLALQDIATPVVHAYRLICESLAYSMDLRSVGLQYSGEDSTYIIRRPFDPFGWYRQ